MGLFARSTMVWFVLGCGPQVVVPADEGSGDAESSSPTDNSTGEPTSPSDACSLVTVTECAAAARDTSSVIGETPIANIRPDYAFFGAHASCDSCSPSTNVGRIVMVFDPGDLEMLPAEGLVIDLFGFAGPTGVDVDAIIHAYSNGATIDGPARVELDSLPDAGALAAPFDPESPAIVRGGFTANDGDWATAGNFVAVYCPSLDEFPLCG